MASSYVARNGIGLIPAGFAADLLTVAEAAERLHAHPHSVLRWADAGLINCYRIGLRGDRRFRPEDLDEFLGDQAVGRYGD